MIGELLPGPAAFRVVELPAYEPSGRGEHLWIEVESRDLTSDTIAAELARACAVHRRSVGFAGRKDRHAVTRQWFSVPGATPSDLERLRTPERAELAVVRVTRHVHKLRRGHLRGNRFRLRLSLAEGECDRLERALARLSHVGMRNGFGAQRFGLSASNLALARAWGRGELERTVELAIEPDGSWRLRDPHTPTAGAPSRSESPHSCAATHATRAAHCVLPEPNSAA